MSIRRIPGETFSNGSTCRVIEYGKIGDADFAEAIIQGRYPEKGFAVNQESDMIIRVISGSGAIVLRESGFELHPGNVIEVNKQTPYYYDGSDLRIVMVCSPAWSPEQYEQVD